MAHPPVSICLVTYNRARLLPQTIDSLLSQSFSDFELIISDDFSTDETEEICNEYAQKDERIRYKRNSKNLGMPGNLNASLQIASGVYLANLHDGDIYREDLIICWKDALDKNPTTGFVFNAYRVRQPNGTSQIYRESYPELIPGRTLGQRLLSRWDSCVFGTVMTRRSVYEKIGWFDPQFGNYSDVDMWLRIARDYDVSYVNKPLMELMPGDSSRFYAFVHWKVVFWLLGIHIINLQRYEAILPEFFVLMMKKYPIRKRFFMFRNMLTCIKHRRWDRVREGFAIWSSADDYVLRNLGRCFKREHNTPDWYKDCKNYWWDMVHSI